MARAAEIRVAQDTTHRPTLFLAFELSTSTWKLDFTTGSAQRPRERSVSARDIPAVLTEIGRAKERFGLPADARVVSCYEAGRDGFWRHRCLIAQGVENVVVDSSSIEVQRRQRRAKTDRLDVHKLLTMRLRHHAGEPKVWSVVHVPGMAEEDRRQLHRELMTVKRDRTGSSIGSRGYWPPKASPCHSGGTSSNSWSSRGCGMARLSPWGYGSVSSVSGSSS
jgi:transposase